MKAMIFAAGQGKRMRPLSNQCPKPLLNIGGKPFIVWHIEKLAQVGITEIIINYAWLGEQFPRTLGNGNQWGVKLYYSAEEPALETAGGIAHALPLLGQGIFLAVSGDIYTDFDFSSLHAPAQLMQASTIPKMYLILVDNPDYYPQGDFGLDGNQVILAQPAPFTYANIGLYDTRSFHQLDPQKSAKLGPLLHHAIIQNQVNGEHFKGIWHNVGTPEQLYKVNQDLHRTVPARHANEDRTNKYGKEA